MNRKMFMGKNLILDIARPIMSVPSPHVAVLSFASEAEQARPVTQNGIKMFGPGILQVFRAKRDWVVWGDGDRIGTHVLALWSSDLSLLSNFHDFLP